MSDGQCDIVDALEYTARALDTINRRSDAKMVRAGKDTITSLRERVSALEAAMRQIASMETMRDTQEDRMKRVAQAAIDRRA